MNNSMNPRYPKSVYDVVRKDPKQLCPVTVSINNDGDVDNFKFGYIEGEGDFYEIPGEVFFKAQKKVCKEVFRAIEGSSINISIVDFTDKYSAGDISIPLSETLDKLNHIIPYLKDKDKSEIAA